MSVREAALSRRQALLEAVGLVGARLVDVVPDDARASHQVLILYTAGGGVAAISNNPPTSGRVGFGRWEHARDWEYVEAFELFPFDPAGAPTGILRIRAASQLNEAADRMTGLASTTFRPAGTATFFPAGTTHFTGERITT